MIHVKKTADNTIHFFTEGHSFSLRQRTALRTWLLRTAKREKKSIAQLNYIFTSDKRLLAINKQYLEHDYYTDIITFDYGADLDSRAHVAGDIFISIDRVKENAAEMKSSFSDELHRVMVHGLLHLCGHGDKSPKQQAAMRRLEDFYLSLRNI